MLRMTRRDALRISVAAGLASGVPALWLGQAGCRAGGPNEEIRVGVIGLGGIETVGGVGGRGRQLIERFRAVPGVRIAAICDVDQEILDHGARLLADGHPKVAAHTDLRRVFDDKSIDVVAIATPNHWHALATIWACQAGKDAYVEKPFSHDINEGRQMVAAARTYGRVVQVGTQRRSSESLRRVGEYLRQGELGPVRCARALIYRPREGIGKVAAPTPVAATVDYDLWCGPAPVGPVMRKQLHYDWHWFWSTGNGEIGNNGAHQIDVARWLLGQEQPPPRVISIGGRLGFADDGETANTQVVLFDYRPAPLVCEIRNFRARKDAAAIGKLRGIATGVVVECEGGYVAGDFGGAAAFDRDGQRIKEFRDEKKAQEQETAHVTNFVEAVRNRTPKSLHADATVGHVSAACCHMANLSHRLGRQAPPEAILETIRQQSALGDAFARCREYLAENGIDLQRDRATLGPWLSFDATREQFVGEFAAEANRLCRRTYRQPFALPAVGQ